MLVANNVRSVLKKLRDQDAALGRHLAATISLGYLCNILKRMESAVNSFALTIKRQLDDVVAMLARLDAHDASVDEISIEDIEVDDPAFETLLIGREVKVLLQDVDRVRWRQDLIEDRNRLDTLLSAARQVVPARDDKLHRLRELIQSKVRNPINPGNRKIIVFTAFASPRKSSETCKVSSPTAFPTPAFYSTTCSRARSPVRPGRIPTASPLSATASAAGPPWACPKPTRASGPWSRSPQADRPIPSRESSPPRSDLKWPRPPATLYIVAEQDVLTPIASMQELFGRTPGPKKMVILPRADHLHFVDDVEQAHEQFAPPASRRRPPGSHAKCAPSANSAPEKKPIA